MARKPVEQRENTTYHVWSRCIEWRPMIENDYFKTLFTETIIRTQQKYNFELNQYQIMDNHIHLIIHTTLGGPTISRIMQFLKARFAEAYNRITGRIGPFWNERYKYSIIQESSNPVRYFLWLLWYLAYNPVRKKLISDPRKWLYGGINAYLHENHKSRVKIHLHPYFAEISNSFQDRIKYLLFIEEAYCKRLSWLGDW